MTAPRGVRPAILLLHPLIAAAVAALGCGLCWAISATPGYAEMGIAAAVTLASAELAMGPLYFVRGKPQSDVAPAAMAGTVVHMLVAASAGLAILQWGHPHHAFIYWLCAFYWASLAGVCAVLVRAIKSAPVPVNLTPQSVTQPTAQSTLQGSEA